MKLLYVILLQLNNWFPANVLLIIIFSKECLNSTQAFKCTYHSDTKGLPKSMISFNKFDKWKKIMVLFKSYHFLILAHKKSPPTLPLLVKSNEGIISWGYYIFVVPPLSCLCTTSRLNLRDSYSLTLLSLPLFIGTEWPQCRRWIKKGFILDISIDKNI